MMRPFSRKVLGASGVTVLLATLTVGLLLVPAASATSPGIHRNTVGKTLPAVPFVSGPPAGAKGPDDITRLAIDGLDQGRAVIWTAFQNGINPDGTPGKTGGPTRSTVVGYDGHSSALVRSINVTGKIDGLTADPGRGVLIATVNEDLNSGLDLIDPVLGTVAAYTYSPSPAVSGNGGTDSIAILNGDIYVSHSNPNDVSQPAEYLVKLHPATRIAQLSPLFYDDSLATDVLTRSTTALALTDPDTNYAMPRSSHRFAGELATIGQADGKIVFAGLMAGSPRLEVLNVSDNRTGNVPPLDGLAVATAGSGTLYVVDAKAGTITALDTAGIPKGTVFVGEPADQGNPLVGTLDLSSGAITPFGNHFASPKGLLFVPGGDHVHDPENEDEYAHHLGENARADYRALGREPIRSTLPVG